MALRGGNTTIAVSVEMKDTLTALRDSGSYCNYNDLIVAMVKSYEREE